MLVQLTNAGLALMQSAQSAIVLTNFTLGSAYGYTPSATQTALSGTSVYSSVPNLPFVEGSNVIKYSLVVGDSAGPFMFGEVGLYYNSTLFAIGVLDVPTQKLPLNVNTNTGGSIIIDFYVPMVGANYQMWANVSQANTAKVSTIAGPEELPNPEGAIPNYYIVEGLSQDFRSFMAYTDRVNEWAFDGYGLRATGTVVASTSNTISIAQGQVPGYAVTETGQMLIQISSGLRFGTVRYVTGVSPDGYGNNVFTVNANMASLPAVGDSVQILMSRSYEYGYYVPIAVATPTSTGVVQPGSTMQVDSSGLLDTRQQLIVTDLDSNQLGALVKIKTPSGSSKGFVTQDYLDGTTLKSVGGKLVVNDVTKVPLSTVGLANGVAGLGSDGKVPSAQLPTVLSQVQTYSTLSNLPATGISNVLYITVDTKFGYFWMSGQYVLYSKIINTTDDVSEGATNLYFTSARARSSISATGPLSYNSSTGVISYTGPTAVTIGSTSVALGATVTALTGLTSVTLSQDPTTQSQAATKNYVDIAAATTTADVTTNAELVATYSPGVASTLTNSGTLAALVIDGYTLSIGQRVLVKNQSVASRNGLYDVTSVGSVASAWVLTRSSNFQSAPLVETGGRVYVVNGTQNGSTNWVLSTPSPLVVGTTSLTFIQQGSNYIAAGSF